jgi:amino acid adenylation domain-containing protein
MAAGDELVFSYRADFLTPGAAEVWVRRFVQVLQAASDAPSACLHRLPLLTEEEGHAVAERAGKARPYDPFTLHEQFLAESKRSPAKVAVVCGGEEVTYAELRVAALKVALGITTVLGEACQENLLIGLLFERSADVAAVILGVLFSGCGYLPIDTRFPPLRIKDILLDAGASCPMVLVGKQEFAFSLPLDYPGRVLPASRNGLLVPPGVVAHSPQMRIASPQSLIYCMYTSGTTGKPKGVMVEHRSLSMRISWFQRQFSLSAEDTVLFKTQYTFGISEWEVFWPLTTGATMLVAPREVVESLPEMVKLIEVSRCTHAFFVPSHLTALLRYWRQVDGVERHACRASLRWAVACGEALPRQVVRDFHYVLPQASIYNLYGPTEGSMTWTFCDRDDSSVDVGIPLGKPIDNTVVVLLDRWQRPVPDGVPGEICFGHCLARGYLNRPDLTAERFVANPFPAGWLPADGLPCPTLYRTGDMAIWMDGELHFAGRVDRQVKFRGYRIELGAIEAAMREAFQVAIAQEVPWLCCLLVPPSAGRPGGELVAFLQSSLSDSEVQVLFPELSARLPPYMVPTKITSMPNLPTLPSGKVDMRALQNEASGGGEVRSEGPDSMQNPSFEEARDSLGQIRQFTAAHSTSLRVLDNLRAFYMYGVVLDHVYGCTESSRCRFIVEALIWTREGEAGSPGALLDVLRFVEVIFRSVGNYKAMSGFMMVSAYADARYTDAAHFNQTDAVMLLAYLQMMWIIDPIYESFCTDDHVCFPSGHRWYLLVVLMIKALLVLFRLARLPPLVQCVAVTVIAFTMPPDAGCVVQADRETRCAGCNDNDIWTAYYPFLDVIWTIFIRGGPEGAADINRTPTVISRQYFFFAMQYFWTFYYGHHCVQMFWGFVDELPRRTARATRWCSFVGFLFIELTLAGVVGPSLYRTMRDRAADSWDPPLLGNLGIFVALSASVMLLAYAISGVKTRLQTLGSTTLGCYIAHWYLIPLLPYFERQVSSLSSLGYPGLILQVPLLMALPLCIQLSVGVAFHRVLMLEARAALRAYGALLTWAGHARAWVLARARSLRGRDGLRAWPRSLSAVLCTKAEDETDPEEESSTLMLPCSMSRVLL